MDKVQRWTGHVAAFEGGGFVAYCDYLKLRAENERLKAELAEANKRIEFQKRAWTEEHEELSTRRQQLLNLVCRIHRDGGHYIAEQGEAKAIADADLVVANNNAELDSLRQRQHQPLKPAGKEDTAIYQAIADNYNQPSEELCIDEGCSHHGTPHVCIAPIGSRDWCLYLAGWLARSTAAMQKGIQNESKT